MDFTKTNELLQQAEAAFTAEVSVPAQEPLYCGVDLGTASVVLVVLNSQKRPVVCEMEEATVVRDGLVVDYHGAIEIVRRLKQRAEKRLGRELEGQHTAIAMPPGTSLADSGAHRNVVEACGLHVTDIVEEPTAANAVLGLQQGVVVDIGGGTTGLAVLQNGQVTYTADEPTGGTHVALVLMGGYGLSFEQAEQMKRDESRAAEVYASVRPVFEKMAGIVKKHLENRLPTDVCLVGGTCSIQSIQRVFEEQLGCPVYRPAWPMLVTPLGIALCCSQSGTQF